MDGAVKTPFAKLPLLVQVTVGPLVIATLSLALKAEFPVPPLITESVAGLKLKTGAAVSGGAGIIVTVRVPVPSLPAASCAVAVQTLIVSWVTAAAVKTPPAKLPPLVQLTVGTIGAVLPASLAVKVIFCVCPEMTVAVLGLKVSVGPVVSGGGGGVSVTEKLPVPSLPAGS